jgi:hypothetical protein
VAARSGVVATLGVQLAPYTRGAGDYLLAVHFLKMVYRATNV